MLSKPQNESKPPISPEARALRLIWQGKKDRFWHFSLPSSFRGACNLYSETQGKDSGEGEGMLRLHPAYPDEYICPSLQSLLCFLTSHRFQLKFSTPGLDSKVNLFWKVWANFFLQLRVLRRRKKGCYSPQPHIKLCPVNIAIIVQVPRVTGGQSPQIQGQRMH